MTDPICANVTSEDEPQTPLERPDTSHSSVLFGRETRQLEAQLEAEEKNNPLGEIIRAPDYLLNRFLVFSIIANRMIGTGIFESPTTIIRQGHNVGASLIFWAVGCIASMAGTLMYVEYGLTIPRRMHHGQTGPVPRNGGELHYLKYLLEIFEGPKFMAACIFGWTFLWIGNSAANCVSFGVHIWAAIKNDTPRRGCVQGIALGACWIVFLLHATSRKIGLRVNAFFAITKVAILAMIIVLGFIVLNNHTHHIPREKASYSNLLRKSSFKNLGSSNGLGVFASYLNIIFTFGGWNQANYVLGEIKKPTEKFRSTSLWTVGTICILYMLTNIAYMIVVPIPQDGNFPPGETVVGQFFKLTIGKAWNDKSALCLMNVCLAWSSLGNVIVTTFTAARVKQELGKEGIIIPPRLSLALSKNASIFEPIKKIVGKIGKTRHREKQQNTANSVTSATLDPVPVYALALHCGLATFLILLSAVISPAQDAYPFLAGLYSYSIDAMVAVCLSFGLIYMRFKTSCSWNADSASNRWFSLVTAIVVFIVNMIPLVALWIPESLQQLGTTVPFYVVPTAGCCLVATGVLYWVFFRFVLPDWFMDRRQLEVTIKPIDVEDAEGNVVQQAEVVTHDWSIPELSRSRSLQN